MTPENKTPGKSQRRAKVLKLTRGGAAWTRDLLSAEEPLELRLAAGGVTRTLAVTMRTPGEDFELAAGFLYAEGVINGREDVRGVRYCVARGEAQQYNALTVDLDRAALPPFSSLERFGVVSSACGVCGKASLEALEARGLAPVASGVTVSADLLFALPERLRGAQRRFAATGGLHAAALFSASGDLLAIREDVGRHNALDKLVGWALLDGRLPLSDALLMVSGRASFELVQKAAAAGVPLLAAVSAPSSLAVLTAQRFGVTLVGFLREGRANVYAHPERVEVQGAEARSQQAEG